MVGCMVLFALLPQVPDSIGVRLSDLGYYGMLSEFTLRNANLAL